MEANQEYTELGIQQRISTLYKRAQAIEPSAEPRFNPGQQMLYVRMNGMTEGRIDCPEIPFVHERELSSPVTPGDLINVGQRLDEFLAQVAAEIFIASQITRDQALAVLALEYKIHLMPKPEYIEPLFARLIEIFRNDFNLRTKIACFKVWMADRAFEPVGNKDRDEIVPTFVIYPSLKRSAAQRVLDGICKAIPEEEIEEIGLGVAARFSRLVNKLVSYAQSGGDLKKDLEAMGIIDRVASLTGRHIIGSPPLQDPGLGEPTVTALDEGAVDDLATFVDPAFAATEVPFVALAAKLRAAINDRSKMQRTRIFRELGGSEGVWRIIENALAYNDKDLATLGFMLILEFYPNNPRALELENKLKK